MTKRKDLVGMLGIVLAFGLVLAGCLSAPIDRYDPYAPEEDDSTLVLYGGMYGVLITEFDHQAVSWLALTGIPPRSFKIRIPSGEHTLLGGIPKEKDPPALTTAARRGYKPMYEPRSTTVTEYNFVKGTTYKVEIVDNKFKITESAE